MSQQKSIFCPLCQKDSLILKKKNYAALAEGLEFVSEETFTSKVKTIKESYFKESASIPAAEVADETPVEGEEVSPAMAQYLQALNRWSQS